MCIRPFAAHLSRFSRFSRLKKTPSIRVHSRFRFPAPTRLRASVRDHQLVSTKATKLPTKRDKVRLPFYPLDCEPLCGRNNRPRHCPLPLPTATTTAPLGGAPTSLRHRIPICGNLRTCACEAGHLRLKSFAPSRFVWAFPVAFDKVTDKARDKVAFFALSNLPAAGGGYRPRSGSYWRAAPRWRRQNSAKSCWKRSMSIPAKAAAVAAAASFPSARCFR